jgi:hypothetical protein
MNVFKSNAQAIKEIKQGKLPPHLKASMIAYHEKLEDFGIREFDFEKIKKLNDFHPLKAMAGASR